MFYRLEIQIYEEKYPSWGSRENEDKEVIGFVVDVALDSHRNYLTSGCILPFLQEENMECYNGNHFHNFVYRIVMPWTVYNVQRLVNFIKRRL